MIENIKQLHGSGALGISLKQQNERIVGNTRAQQLEGRQGQKETHIGLDTHTTRQPPT